MTPAQADLEFLENAKKLSMYGVDLHQAKVRASMCAPVCGFCNLIILPLRSTFTCFGKLLWKERRCGNTHIEQECFKHSCKRSDSLWLLIYLYVKGAFQSSLYRKVLALSNLEYNMYSLPHESLCSRKCRRGSWWALWATSRTGKRSRREEVVRKSMKEKEGWPWSWELESGWWELNFWEDQRDNLEGSCHDMKLINLTLLNSWSAFPGLGRRGYHSGSLFQWPSCLQR